MKTSENVVPWKKTKAFILVFGYKDRGIYIRINVESIVVTSG